MSTQHHETGSGGITPYAGGAPATPTTIVRRRMDASAELSSGPAPTDVTGRQASEIGEALRPGGALEALVDAVVERVEQRVIDELERRGRRQSWAAF